MKKINIISAIILLILVLIVFRAWFISSTVSSGDSWYYFNSMFNNPYFRPYAWYTTVMANGLGGLGYVSQNVSMVVSVVLIIAKTFNLSWETVSRFMLYLPYIFISLISILYLFKKLFPSNKFFVFAAIIFTFNSYILMTAGGGQIITALSYSLVPFTIFSFIKLSEKIDSSKYEVIKLSLFGSLLLVVQTVLDLRVAFITAIAVLVWLSIEFIISYKSALRISLAYVLSFFILGLVNLFWLIPILLYGIDPIQQLGAAYSSSESVKFLSFAQLENSLGLMHPYWPENIFGKIGFMRSEFLILPVLAFSSLFFVNKKDKSVRFIIYFSLLGLLGIFLGKGANAPQGNLYLFLFENVPGFQLFRDSFKWYILISLSFSILIPYSIQQIYSFIQVNKYLKKIRIIRPEFVFVAASLILICFIMMPALLGDLNGTFKTRTVPSAYQELDEYLAKDQSFYRTLWIPQTLLFGHYTNTHIPISGRDFFKQYSHDKLIRELDSSISQKNLNNSGVRYVIIPEDTESEIYLTDRKYDEKKYKKIISGVEKISWLSLDKTFGGVRVYKTENAKDHFWCDCEARISYEMIDPTRYKIRVENANKNDKLIFSEAFDNKWVLKSTSGEQKSVIYDKLFNSFTLPEGNNEFEVLYTPQGLVDFGFRISVITFISTVIVLILVLIKSRK